MAWQPWSLEIGRDLGAFDVIGFSLQYELTYSNMLAMLRAGPGAPDAARTAGPEPSFGNRRRALPWSTRSRWQTSWTWPWWARPRSSLDPLIDLLMRAKEEAWPRDRLYEQAMDIGGRVRAGPVCSPSMKTAGLHEKCGPCTRAHPTVRRRIVPDHGRAPAARGIRSLPCGNAGTRPPGPGGGSRGCTRGCRFCQAGFIYRPVRERPAEQVYLRRGHGGHRRHRPGGVGPAQSLSTGDYTCIEPLATALMDALQERPGAWA